MDTTKTWTIHKHWVAVLPQIWWAPLSILAGFMGTAIGLAVIFLALCWCWIKIKDWKNDTYILGDGQLKAKNRDVLGLHKNDSGATLSSITNTAWQQNGIWQRMFGYGSVQVRTANDVSNMVLAPVPNPERVANLINSYMKPVVRQYVDGAD